MCTHRGSSQGSGHLLRLGAFRATSASAALRRDEHEATVYAMFFLLLPADHRLPVLVSECIDPAVDMKTVRVDDTTNFDHFLNKTVQILSGTFRNDCHANSTDATTIFFCGYYHDGFLLDSSTVLGVFTANACLIHLHNVGELLTPRTNHCST